MAGRRALSIRAKIALTCVGPLAVSIAAGLYWSGRSVQRDLLGARVEAARAQALAVSLSIGIGLDLGDLGAIQAAMTSVRADPDLAFIVVRDQAGEILAEYPKGASARKEAPDAGVLTTSVPISFRKPQGTLVIGFTTARIEARLARDRQVLLAVGGVTLLFGLGTALYFAHRIAGPIRLLQQAARRVAREDFEVVVPIHSNDEVGDLAADFATMTAQLSSHLDQRLKGNAELEAARDAADAAGRAKSQFLATVSHEIRTPMNGVIGMTGLLLDTPLNPEQRDYAETVKTSAEALLTIINDVLDYSKLEAGKLTFEPHPFDLQNAVSEVIELLAPKAGEKTLELALRYVPGTPRHLIGDPGRLRQILMNLVGNAIKFTDAGQVLLVVAEESRSDAGVKLRLSVTDSGIGLTSAQADRLFERFTQADSSTTRRFGGTGLGLAISRQLVELMGGEIGVTSETGLGSTFWFTITLALDATEAPAPPMPEALRGVRALIVDDNPVNRVILDE
ncbi:MAG: ATP-binding protein, partial [Gemmatimonadota bacterium]